MKPKNLKCPFNWETRHPILTNRVLFVPEYYDRHQEYAFPKWSDPEVFGNHNPVMIEYCAGNGAWIVERAKQFPMFNWVAVEIRFDRVRKIWSKIQNEKLSNLLVVCGEGVTFSRYYVLENSVEEVFVNFPDPWPKLRHAKHRIFQKPFIDEIARTVRKGGKATAVTDDPPYCKQIIDEMLSSSFWKPCQPEPYYVTEMENYGSSYFENLWRGKGLTIHYLEFINQKEVL